MLREKRENLLGNHFNPFYKGVCKMKLLRVLMVVALLAVPLFASEAKADFAPVVYDVDFARVGVNTVNQPIIGFTIPCSDTGAAPTPDTLKTVALKSYMERAYSVKLIKLWVETNDTTGWQSSDTHLKSVSTNGERFETPDTIAFAGINRVLRDSSVADEDTFYITVDTHTDSVNASASLYHERGLEVVIETGYIHLGLSSAELNTNAVYNSGFEPDSVPPYFDSFKLIFDTQGPPFTIDWCFAVDGCKSDTIDQLDSLCIQADTTAFVDEGDAIDGYIELDLSAFCLASDFGLKPGSDFGDDCFDANGAVGWDSCFLIPDTHCGTCIDVDSGYVIYATAKDSAGNETTDSLYFDKPIDTCKPNIDSIHFFITYDQNSDGIAAIGDSLAIVAWGFSNPDFEVDSMIANLTSYFPSGPPSKQWRQLDDVTNNNRLFRLKFILEETGVEMASDSSLNRITIWAWDNACNYDTAQQMLNAQVDTKSPSFTDCYYWYHWDANDTLDCIGIADSVKIGANLAGNTDLASVTCDLVEAGIYGSDQEPLFDDGLVIHGDAAADDQGYNLLWEVGEPPIEDGKDTNNTSPPSIDYNYTVLLTAVDTAGNWDTCRTPRLNRILDTRRPRWSNQDDLGFYIKQFPDAKLAIFWPTSDVTPANSCNEKDAVFFFVYVDSGLGWETDPIGATFDTEYKSDTNMWKSEALSDGKYYKFRMVQEDDCNNYSDYSKTLGAVADGTPPHVCIALPDSGLTFGAPFPLKAVADSVSHDVDHSCLWYRFRRDLEDDLLPPGEWNLCGTCMYRPDSGYVFTDTVSCVQYQGYRGWVEIITVSCDIVGNCQDTTMGFNDACLVEDDLFMPGHFLFYWDTLAPGVMVTEVDSVASPQTACGYDVWRDRMNWVIFDVDGATSADSFEVEVRGPTNSTDYIIFHEDNQAMPCTVWFSVDGWPEGTQNLYIYVKDYDNGITGNAQVQICVPPAPPEHCVYISSPNEWERIRCTGVSGQGCVTITAGKYDYDYCGAVGFTQAIFQWSKDGLAPWYKIDEVLGDTSWSTCWDNTDLVEHGDTVYFRVIAHDEYHMADTSYMVKVFVDCEAPAVTMRLEDVYYTCSNETPKVNCDPLIVKAEVLDTMVDIYSVELFVKLHSNPDIWGYWNSVGSLVPAWSDNIWMYDWAAPCCAEKAPFDGSGSQANGGCMWPNDYWDIRLVVTDAAGNVMFDYDGDGNPDDSTFNSAVTFGVAMTVFMDDQAPQPAISMVADPAASIYNVNPSSLLGGSDKAYVQAGNDITPEISVLPSEDTCEVMKVEYFLYIDGGWVHVGTSTDPNHYPVTFNPLTDGTLDPYELEDGWWQGNLKAVLYDSLGNSTEDIISLYILDVTPSQAIIINPLNDSYVYGEVQLSVLHLNNYHIAKVCYEYSSDGETWYPVNGGYPNACVTQNCASPSDSTFALVWHTMNTVDDGAYYLRAVATDCDNNVDDDPPTIRVTVANGLPSVVLDDPRICERTCSDSPLDTLGYVAGTVTLYATPSSTAPVHRVVFSYKSIFGYPDTWTPIGTDYFPTADKYSVVWDTKGMSVADGRYHLKARVYNAAGRYGDSDPITISVDNSDPFTQVVSIMGDPHPDGMNITLGDVIDIEVWAMDSTSDDGWTRCYNSGVYSIEVCILACDDIDTLIYNYTGYTVYDTVYYWDTNCCCYVVDSVITTEVPPSADTTIDTTMITKCYEIDPAGGTPYDGFHTIQWNTSGLEFDGCSGCYYFFVKGTDCLGNVGTSEMVTVYVSDITAPITTIGGFDGNYIYGYSSENVSTLLFEYADSGSTNWIPIGWSSYVGAYCNYLYKTSWDPLALDNGNYQVRVISHDTCSNQNDDMAPVAFFTKLGTTITPYNPDQGALYAMSFVKNWCTGDMQGIVQQTSEEGTPVVIGKYGSSFECIHMQAHLQNSAVYDGSFDASAIADGGTAKFFSSVTVAVSPPPMTGEPAYVTYLLDGSFDIATVKTDLGTHGVYQEGCVEVTIPDGAVDSDRYIWVAPTLMEWAPVTQPDILLIGDANGYATHVSFTDCGYCCSWVSPFFEGGGIQAAGAGATTDTCCFNSGKYAKIKMCYNPEVDTDKEHLAVAWWDCVAGIYSFDNIYYPATVEGFNVEEHTVEFATTCLSGPFVVIQVLDRECEGTISVNLLGVEPYCNGYTNAMPKFTAWIRDSFSGVDENSIRFKLDLYEPGELVTIYDGGSWADGFGDFPLAGYDATSGTFKAGWDDDTTTGDALAAGDHMATVTASNNNIQTCTDTIDFTVDATVPDVKWSSSYVLGKKPAFTFFITDDESGVDKDAIWIDIYDADESTQPYDKDLLLTIYPDRVDEFWVDDTTLVVYLTEPCDGEYMHVVIYDGNYTLVSVENESHVREYDRGVRDCVGNMASAEHSVFPFDRAGPTITWTPVSERPIWITITDAMSGVDWSTLKFYEDGLLICEGLECTDEAVVIDATSGVIKYTPSTGRIHVEIQIRDNAGNLTTESFEVDYTAEDELVLVNPHNFANPFDPRDGTWIVPGLSKDCYVTIKIYDFAGEFVKELQANKWTDTDDKIFWDGTTEGGTTVANGTYLCYIYASCDGSTKTAVVKITVLKEDK